MGNVEISVIIPVYNVEPYLANCLNSVINQTFKNIEIICIDDGSTDNSGAICDAYAQNDNRIKVVHQNNQGLSVARNVGLDLSIGKYISFIDSDDYVHPKFLEILYGLCEDNQCFISMCGVKKVISGNCTIDEIEASFEKVATKQIVLKMLKDISVEYVVVWNKLYRKDLIGNLRFPIYKIYEDEFFTYKVLMKCDSIILTDNNLYFYVKRLGSISNVPFNNRFLDSIQARIERRKFFLNEKNVSEKLYKQSLIALYNSLGYCISNFKEFYAKDTGTISLLERKQEETFKEIEDLNFDRDGYIKCLEQDIYCLRNSWSFRIGRFITFIPRKICAGIRCYRENGLAYTLKRCKEKIWGIFDNFI